MSDNIKRITDLQLIPCKLPLNCRWGVVVYWCDKWTWQTLWTSVRLWVTNLHNNAYVCSANIQISLRSLIRVFAWHTRGSQGPIAKLLVYSKDWLDLGEGHSTQTCSLERSGHCRTKDMPKTQHQVQQRMIEYPYYICWPQSATRFGRLENAWQHGLNP